MERRGFLKLATLLGFGSSTSVIHAGVNTPFIGEKKKQDDRAYWVSLLDKIASPVLENMSRGELRKNMKVDVPKSWGNQNKNVAYMEAIGRLLGGIAPFLSLPDDASQESVIRQRLREQALKSLSHSVDSSSPDYLLWADGKASQPLVDAAFIAQAFLYAPKVLWEPLSTETKNGFIREFTALRKIKPYKSNWLLFAAIIETFLLSIGEQYDSNRIDDAITSITKWYVGDGWYSDGERFHFDHYNGYVIHPMLIDVLRYNIAAGRRDKKEYDIAYRRMQRYASFQERYISPEGTYPVFGRSSTYRVGAFQPLVKLAYEHKLPQEIIPAQVRSALTAVMKRIFIPSTFTQEGWLTLGLIGTNQSGITDSYSNTGSMYLTAFVFIALGLPPQDDFWTTPFTKWTQLKAWSGEPFAKDYAVDY